MGQGQHQGLFSSFFLFLPLMYFKGTATQKTRIFHTLVHLLHGCSSQGWARLKLADRNSFQDSYVGGRAPSTWAIFHRIPTCISGELDGKQSSWRLTPHFNLGCWCCKQWLSCCVTMWDLCVLSFIRFFLTQTRRKI